MSGSIEDYVNITPGTYEYRPKESSSVPRGFPTIIPKDFSAENETFFVGNAPDLIRPINTGLSETERERLLKDRKLLDKLLLEDESKTKKSNEDDYVSDFKVDRFKPVVFKSDASPSIILPALSPVLHPMAFDGKSTEKKGTTRWNISVGTPEWLKVMDHLRAAGWTYYGPLNSDIESIEIFLLKSAWVVFRDLNYTVIQVYNDAEKKESKFNSVQKEFRMSSYLERAVKKAKGDEDRDRLAQQFFLEDFVGGKYKFYTNNVEKFCMAYPDVSRSQERLRDGYRNLKQELEASGGTLSPRIDPETQKYICPPDANENLTVDGRRTPNIFQNFTRVVVEKETQVAKCAPEIGSETSWIPEEYRLDILQKRGLLQYSYMDPKLLRKFIVTLSEKNSVNQKDQVGKYMIVQDENGKAFKAYLSKFQLDASKTYNRNEKGLQEGELTLRQWMIKYTDDTRTYPVLQAILDTPAEDPAAVKKKPYMENNVYNFMIYEGNNLRLMYSDAPINEFRKQMLKTYLGNLPLQENLDSSIDRFIKAVYVDIYDKQLVKGLVKNEIPELYRTVLKDFLSAGKPFDFSELPRGTASELGTTSIAGMIQAVQSLRR